MFATACLCLALLPGCEPAADPPGSKAPAPAIAQGGRGGGEAEEGGGGGGGSDAPGCQEGATRDCVVQLGTHEGVTSCFKGIQTCQNATWGPCGEPPLEDEGETTPPAPPADVEEAGGQVPFGGAAAIPCFDSPCDPTCKQFPNAPPGGIKGAPGAPVYDWKAGSLSDVPSGLLQKGVIEPCDESSDCQFDQVCLNPASGTCARSKCKVWPAAGLPATCDPCVASVCAAEPSCCAAVVGPACAHNLCSTGTPVKSNCDPCAASICSDPAYAFCCASGGSWTAACVARVASVCGKSCSAGSWTQSCVDKVTTVCGALCPAQGCGAACPEEGQCEPWAPGQKNPLCPGIDLTVGVVCAGQGAKLLPVCNRGSATAPAGIPIAVYPANAGKIPSTSPGAPNAQYCSTAAPIPAGHCISVGTCGDLSGNKEIMINPPGVAGGVAECHSTNNWTISPSNPGACGAASPGGFLPMTVEEVYEATCLKGAHPRWGYLTYDTTTPSDSRVEFRVAASDTGSFTGAPEHLLAIARTSAGTSKCGIGGPAPCPLDLAATLGKPRSGYRYLRLRADLKPSGDALQGPTLNQWKITYSCPDAE